MRTKEISAVIGNLFTEKPESGLVTGRVAISGSIAKAPELRCDRFYQRAPQRVK